ncbi:hypothetical protein ASG39_07635 [Rhizobium sp. Leaf371]|uniref:flagellar hook-length control protein FliK n=1 Tax=Rhizobium sp. Leaf371 TaxID=1736355 RepID=UPI000715DDB6|nr:flagellar hook-length control protein FliK [Rhizobium sp. Leaf371]KQS65132.1 hypothetical protein ASG39_07635 [Rhizobium sp. Leaf371]
MNSLDEALPAARTPRASVSAVKSRQGDAEGGAAFQKAFADLENGRETTATTDTSANQIADTRDEPLKETSAESAGSRKGLLTEASTANVFGNAEGADRKRPQAASAPSVRLSAAATLSATLALKAIKNETASNAAATSVDDAKAPSADTAAAPERLAEKADRLQAAASRTAKALLAANEAASIVTVKDATPEPDSQLKDAALSAIKTAEATSVVTPLPTGPAQTAVDTSGETADATTDIDRETAHESKASGTDQRAVNETKPEAMTMAADAAAATPAAEADIRSLMAILGPVTTPPAQTTPVEKTTLASETGPRSAKLAGEKTNQAMPAASAHATTLPTSTEGADQVFRFARADGKVVPMSLRPDAERTVSTPANEQASAKADTVTVLDARRYLGIAPTLGSSLPMTANAQAVAAAITGNGDPTQSLQANTSLPGADGATGKVVNTLKIQMHPIDLGLVTATLRLRDDELQIDLRVQTGEAYRQLTDDQDAMIKALRAQGFQVDQVNVIFTPSDSASGNDGSSQPQGNQQQPSQNGRDTQGGLAAGNGGEGRNGTGQRNADDGRTRQDALREASAAPQPGPSDELYF